MIRNQKVVDTFKEILEECSMFYVDVVVEFAEYDTDIDGDVIGFIGFEPTYITSTAIKNLHERGVRFYVSRYGLRAYWKVRR